MRAEEGQVSLDEGNDKAEVVHERESPNEICISRRVSWAVSYGQPKPLTTFARTTSPGRKQDQICAELAVSESCAALGDANSP